MPIDSAFDQSVICCKMSKNAIRRRSRYPTQFPRIGVDNIIVGFEVLFDFVPTKGYLINLSITHFINQSSVPFE